MKNIEVIDKREIFGIEFNIYGTLEEPLFLAKEVAKILDERDGYTVARKVNEDEKLIHTVCVSGQNRETTFLTEQGVYEVIFQSRKTIANKFKKEVKQILKDIRLKGYYIHDRIKDEQIDELDRKVEELNKKLDRSIRNRWKFGLSSYNFSELAKMCGMKVSDMKDFLVTHNICYMDITTIRVTKEWKPYFDNQNRATIQGASMIFDLVQKEKGMNI